MGYALMIIIHANFVKQTLVQQRFVGCHKICNAHLHFDQPIEVNPYESSVSLLFVPSEKERHIIKRVWKATLVAKQLGTNHKITLLWPLILKN